MTAASKLAHVCFLRVVDNTSKLQSLCSVVHRHYLMKKNTLIAVPSPEVAQYIDQLLWRMPEDSFIPHAIVQGTTREKIAITTSAANVNQASVLINLLPEIHSNPGPVSTIYELLDLTSKEKEAISRKKQDAYRAAGHTVEEI